MARKTARKIKEDTKTDKKEIRTPVRLCKCYVRLDPSLQGTKYFFYNFCCIHLYFIKFLDNWACKFFIIFMYISHGVRYFKDEYLWNCVPPIIFIPIINCKKWVYEFVPGYFAYKNVLKGIDSVWLHIVLLPTSNNSVLI